MPEELCDNLTREFKNPNGSIAGFATKQFPEIIRKNNQISYYDISGHKISLGSNISVRNFNDDLAAKADKMGLKFESKSLLSKIANVILFPIKKIFSAIGSLFSKSEGNNQEKEESKDLACREQNNKWQEAIISHKSEKELFL